jgi:hypothetical protein
VRVREPEAARKKRTFPWWQSIPEAGAVVPLHEAINHQMFLNRFDSIRAWSGVLIHWAILAAVNKGAARQ